MDLASRSNPFNTRSVKSFLLGLLILIFFSVISPITPLTSLGMKVVGIFGFTMIMWIREGIGYPSILSLLLIVVTQAMTYQSVFAVSWGNNLVIFVVAVFGLAEGVKRSGFTRRFALWFVSRPFAAGRPWLMISMFWLACMLMGSVMSGSATCITFMMIGVPLLEELGYKKGDKFAAMFITGIAWVASLSFISTPIGHGSNLLFIDWVKRDAGFNMTFPLWFTVGIPVALIYFAWVFIYFRFIVRPDVSQFSGLAAKWVQAEAGKLGPMTAQEKYSVGVFAAVIACWLFPGFFGSFFPGPAKYIGDLGVTVPPMIGASLLLLPRFDKKPLMTFQDWMAGVSWETFALVAAIYAIAELMGNPATGIADLFSALFGPVIANAPFFVYRLLGQVWVVIQTNLMSNTVAAVTVYQALVPACVAAGIGNPVALGFSIWAGARAGLALPSATTNTAIVTGSGWVPIDFMFRHGLVVSLGVILISVFIVYPLADLILVV